MSNPVILNYWRNGAADAFDTANKLFNLRKYHHSLFFLHLALEKIIKALYVQRKNEAPPVTHDLVRLIEKTAILIKKQTILELVEISSFNIAARYDDYKFKFYKKATLKFATKWRIIGKRLYNQFLSLLK